MAVGFMVAETIAVVRVWILKEVGCQLVTLLENTLIDYVDQ